MGKNSPNVIHETILKDIIDIYDAGKDLKWDEVFKGKKKNSGPMSGMSSIAKASSNLTLVFPVICSRSISIETSSMISKAIEKNAVTMLQRLFSSWQIANNGQVTNGIEYLNQFHSNLSSKVASLDDVFRLSSTVENVKVDDSSIRAIKEDMRNISYYLPNPINESSLLSYSVEAGSVHEDKYRALPVKVIECDIVDEDEYVSEEVASLSILPKDKVPQDFRDTMIKLINAVEKETGSGVGNTTAQALFKFKVKVGKAAKNIEKKAIRGSYTMDISTKEIDKSKIYKILDKAISKLGFSKGGQMTNLWHGYFYKKGASDTIYVCGYVNYQKQNFVRFVFICVENTKDNLAFIKKNHIVDESAVATDAKEMSEKAKRDADVAEALKNKVDVLSKQVVDSEFKKANELMPTTMIINFKVQNDSGEEPVEYNSVVAGVKAKLYPISSNDIITHISDKLTDRNWITNLFRATTRETSFMKDFVLALDKAKIDAMSMSVRNSTSDKMWKVLERRALISRLKKALRSNNSSAAITTLCVSQEEVDILRKDYNVDLERVSTVMGLFESLNLMCVCIVDESLEVAKFIYDEQEPIWDTISFTHLERESSDNTYKRVVNLMTKIR